MPNLFEHFRGAAYLQRVQHVKDNYFIHNFYYTYVKKEIFTKKTIKSSRLINFLCKFASCNCNNFEKF